MSDLWLLATFWVLPIVKSSNLLLAPLVPFLLIVTRNLECFSAANVRSHGRIFIILISFLSFFYFLHVYSSKEVLHHLDLFIFLSDILLKNFKPTFLNLHSLEEFDNVCNETKNVAEMILRKIIKKKIL